MKKIGKFWTWAFLDDVISGVGFRSFWLRYLGLGLFFRSFYGPIFFNDHKKLELIQS